MQSVFVELLVILCGVYLVDCFRWVARSAVLVREVPGFAAWVSAPWQAGPHLRRALAFGLPLPVGSLFAAEPLPLRPLPTCIVVPVFDPRGWGVPTVRDTVISWVELGSVVVDGDELQVGARVLHAFGSKQAAAATRSLLDGLRRVATHSEKKRRSEIEKRVASRFAQGEAIAQLERWANWRGPVRVANTLLFLALFGGLAQFIRAEGDGKPLLAAALLAWVLAVGVNVFAVRRVLASASWPSVTGWLIALGSPLSLIRGGDLVEAELLGGVEPAVLAVLRLPPKAAQALLVKERQELLHPLEYESLEPLGREVLAGDAWLRGLREKHLNRLLDGLPSGASEAVKSGERRCPRCSTAYRLDVSECSSCPGVRLVG